MKADEIITLKMLLGIEDSKQDDLLSFLIDDCINMILGYCRIDVLPQQLYGIAVQMAADMYRQKGYGNEAAPQIVKSITEGENSISYESVNQADFLSPYYKRLNPFKNRKGYVPSDFTRSKDDG